MRVVPIGKMIRFYSKENHVFSKKINFCDEYGQENVV